MVRKQVVIERERQTNKHPPNKCQCPNYCSSFFHSHVSSNSLVSRIVPPLRFIGKSRTNQSIVTAHLFLHLNDLWRLAHNQALFLRRDALNRMIRLGSDQNGWRRYYCV